MHIVFDLETTGLPVRGKHGFYPFKMVSKYNTARIVSVAWIVLDKNLVEKEKRYHIVKPDGFAIPESATKIHGIKDSVARRTGISIKTVLKKLETTMKGCTTLVSHNINFDVNVLMSEMYRNKSMESIEHIMGMNKYCTMLNGKKHMSVGKFPKLSELYFHMTKQTMPNAHNAMYDTEHCCDCYKRLLSASASTTTAPKATASTTTPPKTTTASATASTTASSAAASKH